MKRGQPDEKSQAALRRESYRDGGLGIVEFAGSDRFTRQAIPGSTPLRSSPSIAFIQSAHLRNGE
jgi:hypothetical protein